MKDKTKCCRCENKCYTYCRTCDGNSNFKAVCSYEEWKQKRKEESKHDH